MSSLVGTLSLGGELWRVRGAWIRRTAYRGRSRTLGWSLSGSVSRARSRYTHPIAGTFPSDHYPNGFHLSDTRFASHKGHYVNQSVRGSRSPAKWRISLARFDLPRLRMRRISHPQVVASPIRPTPGATHSVATMPYRPFSPSARLLIPDWAQPKRLLPTPFPQLSPTPIHSGGRGQL